MPFKFNALTGKLDLVNTPITSPLIFKGSITVNTDFPLIADVETGWFYTVTADVTDDAGVTYTNTGQSFTIGDEIAWNGSDWTILGNENDFLRLDTTNGPLTGDLELNKADPELRLTDTGNSEYSRIVRADTSNALELKNRISRPATTRNLLDFDGTTDYVTVDDNANLRPGTGDFTIYAWIKKTANVSFNRYIAKQPTTGGYILGDNAGELHAYVGASSPNVVYSGFTLPIDEWFMAVLVRDSGTVRLYYNGNEVDTAQDSDNLSATGDLFIGAQAGGTNGTNGIITNFSYYSDVRTPAEIMLDFTNRSIDTGDANLVSYIRMDEGTGTDVSDSVGSNDGVITNASWTTGAFEQSMVMETTIIKSEDGVDSLEEGIITFGHSAGRMILDATKISIAPDIFTDLNVDKAEPLVNLENSSVSRGTKWGKVNLLNEMTLKNDILTPSVVGNAINLKGAGCYADTTTSGTSLSFTGSFTFSAWVNFDSFITKTKQNEIIARYTTYSTVDFQAYCYDANKLRFGVKTNTGNYTLLLTSGLNTGQWYNIVGVYDASAETIYLYVDGVLQASRNDVTGTLNNIGTHFTLGSMYNATTNRLLDGQMDETSIWHRALTSDEVSDLYNSNLGQYVDITEHFDSTGTSMGDDIVGIWHFDETTGDVAADSSGNSIDLDLTGTTDSDWIEGKISTAILEKEVTLISSEDGVDALEEGIHAFGWNKGRHVIEGNSIRFNTSEVEHGNIDSSGVFTYDKTLAAKSLYDVENAGLILGYNFASEMVVGTTVYDTSSSGWNGVIYNTPTRITNVGGGFAYDFNGSDQYIGIEDYAKPSTDEYTLMAWVKPDGIDMVGTILGATYNYQSGLDITWDGPKDRLRVRSGYNSYKYSDTIFIENDEWLHVALTRDSSGNFVFYKNGVEAGSGTGLNFGSSNSFYIGRELGGEYFDGGIGDPRMYDRVLTADNILAIANRKQVLSNGGLTSVYARYDSDGNFVVDNDIKCNTTESIPFKDLVLGFNFNDKSLKNGLLFDSGQRNNHATASNLTFGIDDFNRSYGVYGASTSLVVSSPTNIVGSEKTFIVCYKSPSSISSGATVFDIDSKIKMRLVGYGGVDLIINGTNVENFSSQYWTTNKWYFDVIILHADNTTSLYHVSSSNNSIGSALTNWNCNNYVTPSGDDDLYIGSTCTGTEEIAGVQNFMVFDRELSVDEINRVMYKFYELPNSKIPSGDVYVDVDGNLVASEDGVFSGNLTANNLSGTNNGDQDLSGYVPYTGATTNVDLGSNNLTAERFNIGSIFSILPHYTSGLAIQGQSNNALAEINFFTKNGNGNYNNNLNVFGVGLPGSTSNRERISMSWVASSSLYKIATEAGGTGIIRPLSLETEGNNNQVYLNTDGKVGVNISTPSELLHANTSTAYAGIRGGSAFIGNWANTSYAMFGHNSVKNDNTSYALLQSNLGDTYLNIASGRTLRFRVANSDAMTINNSKNVSILNNLDVVGGNIRSISTKTANYTLTSSDYVIVMNGSSLTATLPTASGITGQIFYIKNIDASTCTIDANGTETIDGGLTAVISQYTSLQLISDGTNWLIL